MESEEEKKVSVNNVEYKISQLEKMTEEELQNIVTIPEDIDWLYFKYQEKLREKNEKKD